MSSNNSETKPFAYKYNSRAASLSLYLGKKLPYDLVKVIVDKYLIGEKEDRSNEQFQTFCRGTSKSVAKKRALRFGSCWKCGALLHPSRPCKDMPTRSQSECARVFMEDPVRLKEERTLRPNSNALQIVNELVDLRDSKLWRRKHRLNSINPS